MGRYTKRELKRTRLKLKKMMDYAEAQEECQRALLEENKNLKEENTELKEEIENLGYEIGIMGELYND